MMKITLHEIKIRDLCAGYEDLSITEEGIVGYGGRLNIRPKYQREFVYDDKKRNAVIDTVWNNFPLNVMYWVKTDGSDGIGYELLDGQQRTISICSFIAGEFMMTLDGNLCAWDNLTDTQKNRILDYPLQVYICENGTDEEKLKWFNIINIAGEKLTHQEIRNAIYSGPWVTQAKRYFSKTGCVAYRIASNYMSGTPIRQDYLETVLEWIGDRDGKSVEQYMAIHQHDPNADELWLYFQNVINWVKAKSTQYRREMKGLPWGLIYNAHKDDKPDAVKLEKQISKLMQDSDVQRKSGIYEYVLDGDERHLGIRLFDGNTKREVYERQKGICPICGKHVDINEMEADHITPWSKGGRTIAENCQMLCVECNRRKSDR